MMCFILVLHILLRTLSLSPCCCDVTALLAFALFGIDVPISIPLNSADRIGPMWGTREDKGERWIRRVGSLRISQHRQWL